MTIYFFLLTTFFAYAMLDLTSVSIHRNIKEFQLILLLLVLFLFTAFTKGIGFDVDSYSDFDVISRLTKTEPLFESLYYLFDTPDNVRMISSLICVVIMGYLFKNYSPSLFISLYLLLTNFVLMYMMGVLRQAIALTIVIGSWHLSLTNKKKYTINVIIASLFHNSAIIALLFMFLPKNRLFSKKELFIISLISLSIFLAFIQLVNYMAGSVIDISGKLNHYNAYDLETKPSLSLFILRLFMVSLFYFYKVDNKNSILVNIYTLSIFMSLAFSASSTIGGRLVAYFDISGILVIPMMLQKCPRLIRFPLGLLIFVIKGYQYFWFLDHFKGEYIPYNNWLFNMLSI